MPNPNRQPNNNNWRNNTTVTSYTDTKSNKPKETASKPKRQSFRNAVKNWFASKTSTTQTPPRQPQGRQSDYDYNAQKQGG